MGRRKALISNQLNSVKINLKKLNPWIIAVPRSHWPEVKFVHTWKTDLLPPKSNPFTLQPLSYYWKDALSLCSLLEAHVFTQSRTWGHVASPAAVTSIERQLLNIPIDIGITTAEYILTPCLRNVCKSLALVLTVERNDPVTLRKHKATRRKKETKK